MQNSKLGKKYRLSTPYVPSKKDSFFSAPDFISVTEKFLSDNFKGLFSLEKTIDDYLYINLCEDSIISFFKVLIYEIHAKELIFVNISCNFTDFCIEARLKPGLTLHVHLRQELSRLALSGGFNVCAEEKGILIKKKAFTPTVLPTYARPIQGIALEKRFYEIFFGNT